MSSSEEKAEGHTTTAKPDEEPDQVGSSQRQGADQLDDLLDGVPQQLASTSH